MGKTRQKKRERREERKRGKVIWQENRGDNREKKKRK